MAIGASFGGIEALLTLLPAIRRESRLSIFVVVHLPRASPSLLAQIFAERCALPVREAGDKVSVQPGTIYFGIPDYHLLLEPGPSLSLSDDRLVHYARPSIDVLFESASWVYGERVLGILLSGANQDGARGLKRIHDAGGVTTIQDPAEAIAPTMPRSARILQEPDLTLTLAGIAELLGSLR